MIKVWNQRNDRYNVFGDQQYFISELAGGHGGSDPKIVEEFLNYVMYDGKMVTSPIAARYAVAAGCQASESLRHGGQPLDIPEVSEEIVRYFNESFQETRNIYVPVTRTGEIKEAALSKL